MINSGFPKPIVLIENEIKTLEKLKNDPLLSQFHNKLTRDANSAFSWAQSIRNSFSFESSFTILLDGKPGTAYIGANIVLKNGDKSYDFVSYYLAICRMNGAENVVLRKFHFDYAEPDNSHRQPHPVFHLQQPGKLTRCMEAAGHNIENLYPWLSEPRLPYCPISLALLINLTFREFPDEKSLKFIERGEWRSLIKKNERIMLEPYFEECYKFINNRRKGVIRGSSRLLTNDFYYGN